MEDFKIDSISGKKDNFYGDRSIIVSVKVLKEIKINPLINRLYITDIGFYPHASRHYRIRETGIDENILIYCTNGNGKIQVNGQSYDIEPNSFFIIPALEPHAYMADKLDPWSIYWIHFGGEKSHIFKKFFKQAIKLKSAPGSRTNDRINLFNEILTALELGFSKENIEFANLTLQSLLASFFYINTYLASKGHQSSSPVEQAVFFMQKNLHHSIKIKDIAEHVRLSESQLSKIFRNKTGSSPIDYFINLKMQEAIRLLSNRSLRIKEVAFKLGYDDPFYFSRIFTKHIGVNPGSFLKTSKR
ncbi:MAG: AraC family transcriptional regulator [Bacteroidales bacterium]